MPLSGGMDEFDHLPETFLDSLRNPENTVYKNT